MNKFTIALFFGFILILSSCGPTARFSYDQKKLEAPSVIKFKNDSKKAESYEWDFGDGQISTEKEPAHQYVLSGKYKVKLKAKKGNQTRTTSKDIFIKAPNDCLVLLQTEYGDMLIKLHDETPLHRDNFIKLAEKGFYNDLLFHRVIDGFMIQGGDPNSKGAPAGKALGSGGPGYQIDAEINAKLPHIKGALAAARTGDSVNPKRRSSGSQFYIVHGKPMTEKQIKNMGLQKNIDYTSEQKKVFLEQGGTPFLDMNYTVFGQVIDGLDVIDKIAKVKKDQRDRPVEDVKMTIHVIK